MPEKPKLSIIILVYKSKGVIRNCLDSIYKYRIDYPFEVIIVDNNKIKIGRNFFRKYKNLKYLTCENKGFGAGINFGSEFAQGDYLLFLNSDTKVFENSINNLVNFLKRNKKVGLISPVLLDRNKNIYKFTGSSELTPFRALFCFSFINKYFPANSISRKFFISDWNRKTTKEVDVVPGAAMMIKKKTFEEVGKFDENLFIYFEENDLSKRLRKLGYQNFVVSNSKIMHLWEYSTSKNREVFEKIFRKSRFYYFKKHFGIFKAFLLETFLRLNFTNLLIISSILIGLFLRFYKLEENIPFGGEQGQNYLQLRNYYENKEIPLKGPPTGRSWLWLGPVYYWIMLPLFVVFSWNPTVPSYFFAFISLFMAYINYRFCEQIFNSFTARLSTIFLLISPIWLTFTRHARFYFLVTFFSYFYFLFLIRGLTKNKPFYIYLAGLFLSIMLNFHYSALILLLSFVFLFLKRKIIRLKKSKLLFYFLIPQVPFLMVNLKENFVPIVKTAIWIPYRIAGFLGIIEKNRQGFEDLVTNIKSLFFIFSWHFKENGSLTSDLLGFPFFIYSLYLLYKVVKKRKINALFILLTTFWIFYLGLFIHGNPSYHYYVPILPIFPLILAFLAEDVKEKLKISEKKVYSFVFLSLIILNFKYFFSDAWFGRKFEYKNGIVSFELQKLLAQKIVQDAQGRSFSVRRVGPFDYYQDSFSQNYQYLLWWMGNKPKEDSNILYTIYEGEDRFRENSQESIIFRQHGLVVTKKQK